ncbi:MAG TPA: hypothetical protein PL131_11025 [Methylotenera sp.]|nr:hypothetical protein [Methylotenera sp.]HPH06398.1 hypothetical protein [Methylotenera sp.]HPN01826.1 hypothetical protein [Methylotenera sp.]
MSENSKTKTRIYRSLPLIPVFLAIFSLIVMLSPMVWQSGGLVYFMFGAIGLSLVCAYCATMFMDQYFEANR